MHCKFASIEHADTHAYAFESETWSSTAQVNTNFRMYQTYGENICQHSNDWSITTEFVGDYLLSLAQYMLTDNELAERLYYPLHNKPSAETIAFAASVVYKVDPAATYREKKTRYFSIQEKKITTSESKRYDKRYEEVAARHDGSAEAIYNMLIPEYASGLQQLVYATAIREWCNSLPSNSRGNLYMELPAIFLKWTEDRDNARNIRSALEAAQEVCEAQRLRNSAQCTIDCTKRNMESRKQREIEAAAEAQKDVA